MTGFDLSSAQAIYLGGNLVDSVYIGSTKLWPLQHDYSKDYFTFEVLEAGTITLNKSGSAPSVTLQYSSDNGNTWNTITNSSSSQSFGTFDVGDKIIIKGENTKLSNNYYQYNNFGGTAKTEVYGNSMSLLYGDNFINQTTLPSTNSFTKGFVGYTNLISAEHLILPATTLTNNCYQDMFDSCSGITKAPELPATVIGNDSYENMFNGCSSLTTAPVLHMATIPYYGCNVMFRNCSNLNYIETYATDRSGFYATNNWVQGVQNVSGTFKCYKNVWPTGNSGIPSNWTVEYFTVPMTGISLNKSSVTVSTASPTTSLTATLTPFYTSEDPVWTSSDTSVATVTQNGVVSYVGTGTATITAASPSDPTVYATCNFTVGDAVSSVTLSDNSVTLDSNNTYKQLTATVLPSTAIIPTLNWTSSNTSVATVNSSGMVTGVNGGTCIITAKSTDGSNKQASCFITCTQATNIDVTPSSFTIDALTTQQLSTTFTPSTTFNKNVTWASSDTSVATVDANGLVTGVNHGTCTITATATDGSGIIGTSTSTITIPIPVTAITLSESSYIFNTTDPVQLTATITPNNATIQELSWTTSDANIATVNNNGKVSPMGIGSCTITATAIDGSGVYATCSITSNVDGSYEDRYLTIEITDDTASNNATITLADTKGTKSDISYSLDNGSTWTTVTTWPTNLSNLSKGDKILLKGVNDYLANNYAQNWFSINGDKEHMVYGNIASLIYGDNFVGQTETKNAEFCFGCLFRSNTKLVDATNLILSLTKEKARGTYISLFRGCSGLVYPPTTLPTMDYSSFSGDITFQYIFEGCTSLVQTPDMTNMTITTACLEYAFSGCTSLTSAELPHVSAINKNYCYRNMFYGCTSLNYIKCLSTSRSTSSATTNWLNNVASSGTFVKDANATFWGTGSSDIPSNWTVQNA